MTKQLSRGLRAGFVVALTGAAVVSGAASAVVMAAIPSSSDGQIHACYRNNASLTDAKGALRVIDSEAGQICTAQETGLNWPAQQGSGLPILKDGNGQVLGSAVDMELNLFRSWSNGGAQVYNSTLKRIVFLVYNRDSQQVDVGTDTTPYFQSTNCTGQSYVSGDPGVNTKTFLFRWGASPSVTYAVVADNATAATVTVNSYIGIDNNAPELGPHCIADPTHTDQFISATPTNLPFNTPLATPFKF